MKNTIGKLFGVLSLISILFFGCKKTEDDGEGMDFKINGIKDITVAYNQTVSRTLTLLYLGGKKEEVSFSVSGLPAGITITTDPLSGTPDFYPQQIINVQTPSAGIYTVTITGTTPSGKSFSKSFKLTIVAIANLSPQIYLSGANPLILTLNSNYVEPGFNAVDAEDGNLNAIVMTSNTINRDSVGQYKVSYVVYDSEGLKDSVVRTVFVENSLNYLNGQYTCSTNNITTGNIYNWITSVNASVSVNNDFKIIKISDCYLADAVLSYNPSNGTINMPSQTFYSISSTDTTNHTFVGTGNIINTGSTIKIAVDYQVTYFSSLQGMLVTEARKDTLIK